MKLLPTFAVAALLTAGAAFAASTPPTATAGATATPAAAPAAHESLKHCEAQAKDKKLTGDEAKKFVRECRHGAAKTN
jgi:psiF repeat-containing protein